MPTAGPPASRLRRSLAALGLHRPELRAWALYDPGSAAVTDVVVTAVFPIYYATVVAADVPSGAATARFAALTTATLCALALLAPALGALADASRTRKRMLAAFVTIGAPAVALLCLAGRGDALLASLLFLVANVGIDGGALFHGALLRHVARDDELDRTSTTACALGYVAGGLVLLLVLVATEWPAWFGFPAGPELAPEAEALPARVAFVAVAVGWVALTIPLLRNVSETPRDGGRVAGWVAIRGAGARVLRAVRGLRDHPQALRFAAASLLFGSGMGTIERMAVIYGAEMGIGSGALLLAIVVVNLVGTPFAFLFGAIAERVGAKRAILLGLVGYTAAAILAYFIRSALQFFAVALVIAVVQGGTQALSRSLFASLLPPRRSAEYFGVLQLTGKLTAMIGPGLFAAVAVATGSSRGAILSVVAFFVSGAVLLTLVDVRAGQREASVAGSSATQPG